MSSERSGRVRPSFEPTGPLRNRSRCDSACIAARADVRSLAGRLSPAANPALTRPQNAFPLLLRGTASSAPGQPQVCARDKGADAFAARPQRALASFLSDAMTDGHRFHILHGTTTRFAALDVASGFVIGKCCKRHRAVEFLNFIQEIDDQIPKRLDVQLQKDILAETPLPASEEWTPKASWSSSTRRVSSRTSFLVTATGDV